MGIVGLRELRQHASDLVRRAEAGEDVTITVSGRPSVRLVAVEQDVWQSWDDIAALFTGNPDPDWAHDRDLIEQQLDQSWCDE